MLAGACTHCARRPQATVRQRPTPRVGAGLSRARPTVTPTEVPGGRRPPLGRRPRAARGRGVRQVRHVAVPDGPSPRGSGARGDDPFVRGSPPPAPRAPAGCRFGNRAVTAQRMRRRDADMRRPPSARRAARDRRDAVHGVSYSRWCSSTRRTARSCTSGATGFDRGLRVVVLPTAYGSERPGIPGGSRTDPTRWRRRSGRLEAARTGD